MVEDWNEEAGLRWRTLSPFGGEIAGNLGEPMSPPACARFAALLREHGLVVVRGQ